MLSFSPVAEALAGLIYHRPSGENFSFVDDKILVKTRNRDPHYEEIKLILAR